MGITFLGLSYFVQNFFSSFIHQLEIFSTSFLLQLIVYILYILFSLFIHQLMDT